MNIINVILHLFLSLFSFECNASPDPAAPAAPQYPAALPLKAKATKESKDKNEAQGQQAGQKRLIMHDAAIFLDVSENHPGVVTNSFALALCQNGGSKVGYPVIGTSYVFHNFLNYADASIQKVIPAVFASFDIYKTIRGDFHLFIPKSYIKHVEQSYSDQEKEGLQKIACAKGFELNDFLTGFALSKIVKVNNPEQKNIKIGAGINIVSLQSIFLQKKEVNESDNESLGIWNFALDGHGLYSEDLKERIERGQLPGQIKELNEYQFADARIAGLTLNQYRDLLQFFIKSIKTNFLYYSSCYVGGYNTILGYVNALVNRRGNILNKTKPNFIVAAGGLTDAAVLGVSKTNMDNCLVCLDKSEKEHVATNACILAVSKDEGTINYVNFFNALHKYARKDQLVGTIFKDDELREILGQITVMRRYETLVSSLAGIPLVMFPGTDIFRAVDIDGTISIISEVLLKTHGLETGDKKVIVAKDKEAILIYPANVSVEINISGKKPPMIVSMIPTISLQKFAKINFNTLTFYDFINALGSLQIAFNKYYYIKELILENDAYGLPLITGQVRLLNVLIQVRQDTMNLVFCDDKNNIYQSNFEISRAGITSLSQAQKLSHEFFDVISSQDQFLNALINYFVDAKIEQLFSYETIFEKLLSQDEISGLSKGKNILSKIQQEKIEYFSSWI